MSPDTTSLSPRSFGLISLSLGTAIVPGSVSILQGTRGTCVEPARLGCLHLTSWMEGRVLIPCCQGVQGLKRSCTTRAWPSSCFLVWISWMVSRFCSVSLHGVSSVYWCLLHVYIHLYTPYTILLTIYSTRITMCMIVHLFEMHVFVWNHSGDLLKRFLWRRPRTSDSCQKSRLKRCLAESWCLQCQIENAEDSQFGLDEELPEKRSRGWRFGIEVCLKGQIPANQNDQSQKYLFEKNLDVWPAVSSTFHCRWRTRPRPRSVQLKHRNTWKCNCKRKQISFFFENVAYERGSIFPETPATTIIDHCSSHTSADIDWCSGCLVLSYELLNIHWVPRVQGLQGSAGRQDRLIW